MDMKHPITQAIVAKKIANETQDPFTAKALILQAGAKAGNQANKIFALWAARVAYHQTVPMGGK